MVSDDFMKHSVRRAHIVGFEVDGHGIFIDAFDDPCIHTSRIKTTHVGLCDLYEDRFVILNRIVASDQP